MAETKGPTPQVKLQPLPIDSSLAKVRSHLAIKSNLVLTAAPGAGKTTRVPPAVVDLTTKKVLMLQPRRIAAKTAAARIASEQGWKLGEEIGYQVRNEAKFTANTKIIILTEALLIKKMLVDPELKDVGIIIFDEFHERSIHSDLSLSLCRELQILRDDLKLIVMSATIETLSLSNFLDADSAINVEGRTFPVAVQYDNKSQRLLTDFDFFDRVVEKIQFALRTQQKGRHILCFLPGLNEIKQIGQRLQEKLSSPEIIITPLHGSLDLRDQELALAPFSGIKVILSTNVAETSLTINGVDTVIDSGLARKLDRDEKKAFPLLKTTRITLASAEQRKGRAGREFEGRCFRLWTQLDEQSFEDYESPQIHTEPLEESLLTLIELGVSNLEKFSWYETPEAKNFRLGIEKLKRLRMIDSNLQITPEGKKLVHWPLPLVWGKFLLDCLAKNNYQLGALTAALIADRDYFQKTDFSSSQSLAKGSDLLARIFAFSDEPQRYQEIIQNFQQYCRLAQQSSQWNGTALKQPEKIEELYKSLMQSFIDRLCRRRRPKENSAVTLLKQGVELNKQSICLDPEFFIALGGRTLENQSSSIVDIAVPISKDWILQTFKADIQSKKTVDFSEKDGSFFQTEKRFLYDLEIEQTSRQRLSDKEIEPALCDFLKQNFKDYADKISGLTQLRVRLQLIKKDFPTIPIPDWNTEVQDQLIEMATMGSKNLDEILEKDWIQFAELILGNTLNQALRREFPNSIQLPNGKTHNIEWTELGPSLSVRLQECMGWSDTPTVGSRKQKIKLILLGPNYRPLQTTSDLSSFWKNGYQEIRGPMRARYPKHAWPDDPTVVPPPRIRN